MKSMWILVFVFASGAAIAQQQLVVKITNINHGKSGKLHVALFNNEETFLKKAFKVIVVDVENTEAEVMFENVPTGQYAISIIHDENQNKKLDSNVVGIPKEGFGFSQDAMGMFGPPAFDKASITVDQTEVKTAIKLRYM